MKNFYEILEIDQNASQEIVEKAYKVLVKKYHPDLQVTPEGKNKCEEKIKQINEAYDTISNPDLRAAYDEKIQEEYNKKLQQKEEQIRSQYRQNVKNIKYSEVENVQYYQKQRENEAKAATQQQNDNINTEEYERQRQKTIREMAERENQYRNAINKAYHDAYIQDLKNRGYKIKYKKSLNDYLRSLVALLITIGIVFLIVQIPFIKDYINELYQNNAIIRGIADFIINLFK